MDDADGGLENFSLAEKDLAARLGVARDEVAQRRDLALEGKAWARRGGRGVCWTPEAAEKLAGELLGAPVGNGATLIEVPPAGDRRILLVVHARFKNTRLIACVLDQADAADRAAWKFIRVLDAAKFVPGTATGWIGAVPDGEGHWIFDGAPDKPPGQPPRCPRFRGKW